MRKILKCLAKGFASALLVFLGLGAGRSVKALELQAPIRGAGADISDAYYALGLKETPKLLKRANILCTVTQAAYIGKVRFSDGDGSAVTGELYEAACREGLGYLVDQRTDNSPAALDCIAASGSGNLACMLPNNRRPAAGLDPYLRAAGVKCSAVAARLMSTDLPQRRRRYEVECSDGGGYIVTIPLSDGTGPAPEAVNCLQAPGECTFTSHVDSVAMLAHAIGHTLGADCRISDARYVGFVGATGRDLYELGCQSGHDGLLVEIDSGGLVRSSMLCANTRLKGASCKLKPSDVADPLISHAQNSGASPPLAITHPNWLRWPSGPEFDHEYPQTAREHRLSGQADLACRVDASGLLINCFVANESPAGYGFGKAALKLSVKFRMKPAMENGVPLAGEHVFLPIDFQGN